MDLPPKKQYYPGATGTYTRGHGFVKTRSMCSEDEKEITIAIQMLAFRMGRNIEIV